MWTAPLALEVETPEANDIIPPVLLLLEPAFIVTSPPIPPPSFVFAPPVICTAPPESDAELELPPWTTTPPP